MAVSWSLTNAASLCSIAIQTGVLVTGTVKANCPRQPAKNTSVNLPKRLT